MKSERQYAVEVLDRYQHGKYGKEFFFGMYVPAYSKKDAEEAALDMVAEMSFNDIKTATVDKAKHRWDFMYCMNDKDYDKPVGIEFAEKFFTCKAYIEK